MTSARHSGHPVAYGPAYWAVVAILVISSVVAAAQNNVFAKQLPSDQVGYRVDEEDRKFIEIVDWVVSNTDDDSVFMWAKPSLRYLVAKRKAVTIPTTAIRERVLGAIDRGNVDYVAIDQFSDRSLRYVKPVIDQHPERFSVVYQNGTTTLYRVVR